ncbi:MAG: undecaprenyldiphospho-muramoylpentapeptide beta-N-acetylglucosaminyltransferase [Treponema sp.]|jgi:UDP-N-acetylglucosamine--N-acetylmuramyl-(pentapeptide) pyrophosphoryl-undecaprenol N-acetylglucosamine transferase|nr:undecaprenyldiphospho-muramoylpentapeptide beta-N-acetylglucosaminyltransferase [Treponema sp.]
MVSIALTGGGTGGHIYPGLAIASALKAAFPCRLFWIGSDSGMDRKIVEDAGMEFFGIPSGKLRRYFSLRNVSDVFKIARGFFAARRVLKKERPALLFSKGGFVSVPPCAAAKTLGIPVFTHESDYSPGLATRINSRFVERIFIPYNESTAFYKSAGKVSVSGNPIRTEFTGADAVKGRAFLGIGDNERVLLVLGGSSGSLEVNKLVRAALPELTKLYTVVHQTGENDEASEPPEASARYKPYAYFRDEIPHVIAAAELVLCRSGAGTIWECKSLGKPMVLIPLRGSGTRGDQVENARLFGEAGAAICFIPDEAGAGDAVDASAAKLSALVASLAEDPERRRAMGEAKIGMPDAAAFIAKEIINRISEVK